MGMQWQAKLNDYDTTGFAWWKVIERKTALNITSFFSVLAL